MSKQVAPTERVYSKYEITKAILMYSACSASLLMLNKLVISEIPLHSYVACIQFLFASFVVVLMKLWNFTEMNLYEFEKTKVYSYYVLTFIVGLYSNFRALESTSIETVIVFRACTPILVSVLDYFFLGRELPSRKSFMSLCIIVMGAIGYVATDKQVDSRGLASYSWVFIWFFALCFNMTYGKIITKQVKTTIWESVYYTNILSILPMYLFGTFVVDEPGKYQNLVIENTTYTYTILFLSCLGGLGIGYSGWQCRVMISPASYTLVGVVNKLLTVTMSIILINDGASWIGITMLVLAISGAAMYQQAPLRPDYQKQVQTQERTKKIEEEPLASTSDNKV